MRAAALICTVLAAMAACAPAGARMIEKDYHETFEVAKGVKLVLIHGDGDVTITPWERDVIDVAIRYRADVTAVGFGKETDFTADFKQTEDSVVVRGNEGGSAGIFFFHKRSEYEYTYTISAPSYVALELRGDDGDVELSGWRADIDCELDDGDIALSDVVTGRVVVDLEDGDVRIGGLHGRLEVRGDDGDVTLTTGVFEHALLSVEDGAVDVTDSRGDFEVTVDDGDVDFRRVTAGRVDIRGNDGDVDLDLAISPESNINVATDDGDVTIRLGGELSFKYLVTMDDGDVDVYLEGATSAETEDHRVSGTVGAGQGLVRVRTSDGDVTLVDAGS